MARLTGFSKFLITLLIVGAIAFGFWYFLNNTGIGKKINDQAKSGQTTTDNKTGTSTSSASNDNDTKSASSKDNNAIAKNNATDGKSSGKATTGRKGADDVVNIGVVTWGGYAGGQYFNEGFSANEKSRFYKDYGFKVDFKVLDDLAASREAFKNGDVDLLWATVDALPTEMEGLKEVDPKIVFQADWSRGGDAVVVRRGINKVSDLKGKKIAVALMSPSHSFLLWLLEAGDLKPSDVQIVEVPSAVDAAAAFKSKNVDAAVVWSPDDEDCVQSVKGAKVLKSTKTATNIIADVFLAKKEYINNNKERLKQLFEGWMKGAAEINDSEVNKRKAAKILSEGLNMPEDFCYKAINNVRLCTYGDNMNFFGLNSSYNGVKGEELYGNMTNKYKELGYANNPPSWRFVADPSIVRSINLKTDKKQAEEKKATFTPVTKKLESAPSFSEKKITIHFPSGSHALSEDSKQIIDDQFVDIAKAFGSARIRIEGNTDSKGSRNLNVNLSKKRAQSVADYLINEYQMDKNRLVVVGNGPDKPVADNKTDAGRAKNRRTEFHLLNE